MNSILSARSSFADKGTQPLDIVAFVNARANQRWNCFKSDKVAEISYASE
jgi:hypothetical protein